MDRLQRWFGGKGEVGSSQGTTQDNTNFTTQHQKNPQVLGIPVFPEFKEKPKEPKAVSVPSRTPEPSPEPMMLVEIPKDAKVTETGVEQWMSQCREKLLKVVPLAEGDCLSCKLIGTGAMWAGAGFVLFSFSKGKARYTGTKRAVYTIQALSLSSGLWLLGAARFFDLSFFAPPDEKGNKKNVLDLLKEDLQSVFPSSMKSSQSKSES